MRKGIDLGFLCSMTEQLYLSVLSPLKTGSCSLFDSPVSVEFVAGFSGTFPSRVLPSVLRAASL